MGDKISIGLSFDDVLLVPQQSAILPSEADISTRLTAEIALNIPIVASAMDTVTEAELAIALAREGGIGVNSLTKIARNNKVTVADIVRANKLSNADVLSVNQVLRIPTAAGTASSAPAPEPSFAGTTPAPKPAPSASATTPETNADDFGLYEVQKGDTLWSLSRDFFTTQQEIQQLNNMGRSTILKPGQELIVPTKKYFEYHNRLSHSG